MVGIFSTGYENRIWQEFVDQKEGYDDNIDEDEDDDDNGAWMKSNVKTKRGLMACKIFSWNTGTG